MLDSAVLLIDCPDRRGLVARVSSLLYEHGANILHADQHRYGDLGLFFMRVEWALESDDGQGARFDLERFKDAFAPMARELEMHWSLSSSVERPRMVLLCSRHLHCMADLLSRWRMGELRCNIPFVVSNHMDVEPLATFYGIPFVYIPVTPETREEAEEELDELLAGLDIELVVLARYMQILSPSFVERYPTRIINVHHSFLPAFEGARPYHRAHARGVKLIGATSHYVTGGLDDGPIIEQEVMRVSHRDEVEDMVTKGRDLERIVLSRAVKLHLERRILRYGNKTVVFD
jgi:formyltetrahydrofolate deformylase